MHNVIKNEQLIVSNDRDHIDQNNHDYDLIVIIEQDEISSVKQNLLIMK